MLQLKRFFTTATAVLLLASCGGSKSESTLLVSKIDEAVAAVAEVLQRQPKFYEINATPTLVNLFAADGKGNAINFVYNGEKLEEETAVAPADGTSFDASDFAFEDAILKNVEKELPESTIRAFTVTADGLKDAVTYRVVIQSDLGGQFAVLVDPAGKILGSDPLDAPEL